MERHDPHAERVPAKARKALTDRAETDDAERPALDIPSEKGMTFPVAPTVQRIVRLDHLLRETDHHAERMLDDPLSVQAGLIDDEHTGLRAVRYLNGIVSRPGKRDRQQVGTTRDQRRVACISVLARDWAVRMDLIGACARQRLIDRRERHLVVELGQRNTRVLEYGLENVRIRQPSKIKDFLPSRHIPSLAT